MSMDEPTTDAAPQAPADPQPPAQSQNIIYVELTGKGFKREDIRKYIEAGFAAWGEVNIQNDAGDPIRTLVLKRGDGLSMPVALVTQAIYVALREKGGLDTLTRRLFNLSLGAFKHQMEGR